MDMHAFFDHAGSAPVVIGISVALGVIAVLVARYRKDRRSAMRRALVLYGLYLAAAVVDLVLAGRVGPAVAVGVDLFQAWTLVALVSIALFDLVLPATGLALVELTSDLLTGAGYLFVTLAVLGAAGLDFTSLLAASTVAGVVLTVSLQSTLGNIVGGLALQLEGSVRVGDWLQLDDGRQGRVTRIRWRHTTLETRDWDTLVVPNTLLLSNAFTILGQREGQPDQHRQWVLFNVDFRHSPAHVVEVVQDALRASPIPGVASSPPPDCVCLDLARDGRDSFAVYAVRYFLRDLAADAATDTVFRSRIRAALRRAGVPLARPSATLFAIPEDADTFSGRAEGDRTRALDTLRAVDLFRTLTDEERAKLASQLVYSPFDEGETITRQGAIAHWLYLIHSGSAEVRTSVDGAPPKLVQTLDAPSFFGEMGLMTGEPRLASVVAITPVICYRLDKDAFQEVVAARPAIAAELSALLAKRRMELIGIREDLDEEARRNRMESEQVRILERIRGFFGIGE